ncbi:MAG: single-stranded DNA-binding protein [Actinomycetota bacterium]|nr:single-stranded DNA-binding protein [Actinomycetota bacterium]
MYGTPITVVGNVSDEPSDRLTQSGKLVANFRVASTPRRFDKASNSYVDSETLWLGVVCWQSLARNVLTSIKKGQPVVVTGRLVSREFVKDEQRKVRFEIIADAVGHNLARGTSTFEKAQRVGITSAAVDEDGVPENGVPENEAPEDYPGDVLGAELIGANAHNGAVAGPVNPLPGSGPLVPLG